MAVVRLRCWAELFFLLFIKLDFNFACIINLEPDWGRALKGLWGWRLGWRVSVECVERTQVVRRRRRRRRDRNLLFAQPWNLCVGVKCCYGGLLACFDAERLGAVGLVIIKQQSLGGFVCAGATDTAHSDRSEVDEGSRVVQGPSFARVTR